MSTYTASKSLWREGLTCCKTCSTTISRRICWCPSASVAYAAHARAWLSRALAAEVNDGLLNEREAMVYATRLMRENQLDCFDVAGRRAALLAAAQRAG
jgi:hypothetical protein